ncbi:uncharacterized protein DS421_16g531970 [Arachis hypogaea]|nr:uncharacterized protein DS421_16g531970 [Arachis hypogaea]
MEGKEGGSREAEVTMEVSAVAVAGAHFWCTRSYFSPYLAPPWLAPGLPVFVGVTDAIVGEEDLIAPLLCLTGVALTVAGKHAGVFKLSGNTVLPLFWSNFFPWLSRMWEVMFECHKLQFQIISVPDNNSHAKIAMHSELHRQITSYLEDELLFLSSSLTKWIGAQKSYLEAISGWLNKCVSFKQKSTRKRRKTQSELLRDHGPPIYATCIVWLEKLNGFRLFFIFFILFFKNNLQ